MSNGDAALRVRGLTRHFGGLTAVGDVDLDVAHGVCHTVIGPNGAGKTTLFKLVFGELTPSAGRIELFGRDVTALSVRRRVHLGVGRTFQNASVFDGLNVGENLQLALLGRERRHLSLWPLSKRSELAPEHLAEEVGLGERMGVPSEDLSHGERRQLEIGMALAGRPRMLLLDEPAAGLGAQERERLVELLRAMRGQRTLLLIEHDMDLALGLGELVTMLHDGKVVAEGTPDEIKANALVHDLYLGGRARAAGEQVSGDE